MILPELFKERMKATLGEKEYEKFLAAFDTEPVRALRVNTLKINSEDFSSLAIYGNLAPIPFCNNAYYFDSDGIGNSPLHHAGAIYVQEPGAMAPVSCLDIKPGMKVLDVCASPGGKSLQAAAMLGGKGVIVSNEIVPSRCQILMQNIERLGVRNSVVTNTDSSLLAETYPKTFDAVIVDAPCSGEGMMRKNPLAVSEWSGENIRMCAERQKEILANAAKTVKAGGFLLYSTCTFAPEENELQIDAFLTEHADFSLLPVKDEVKAATAPGIIPDGSTRTELSLCRRFYPHISPGEGQFLALMQRGGTCLSDESRLHADRSDDFNNNYQTKKGKSKRDGITYGTVKGGKSADITAVLVFLRDALSDGYADKILLPESEEHYVLTEQSDGFYLEPDFPMPQKCVFSRGVKVGTVQKGRIVPHHRFFMAFGQNFRRRINLAPGSADAAKYLRGETFGTDVPDGIYAVCVCGCALGGAKVSGGVVKNYYPKGLRLR